MLSRFLISCCMTLALIMEGMSLPIAAPPTAELKGKMFNSGAGIPYYSGYPMYGGGYNEMDGGYFMKNFYKGMVPGGAPYMPSYGGTGYIPNYLQQYDMLYSRSRY